MEEFLKKLINILKYDDNFLVLAKDQEAILMVCNDKWAYLSDQSYLKACGKIEKLRIKLNDCLISFTMDYENYLIRFYNIDEVYQIKECLKKNVYYDKNKITKYF